VTAPEPRDGDEDPQTTAALIEGRLSGPEREAALAKLSAREDDVAIVAVSLLRELDDEDAVSGEINQRCDMGVGPVSVSNSAEEEMAEAEMFADLIRDALLTHFDGTVRPVHRVAVGRLLRGGSAVALLAALDAAREMAAHGESRRAVRNAFILALTEREAPQVEVTSAEDLAERQTAAEAQEREVGPDAFLLYRMADERAALARDAAGIDLAEEAQASVDASSLRTLAVRHAVHHARRGTSGRAPWVEEGVTPVSERNRGAD
jgi:hypothetical protein